MKSRKRLDVLVYRLSALGDVAMTIPAIYSCANSWPEHTLHVVTSKFCSQLFINTPPNVIVHSFDTSKSTWQLLSMILKIPVDAVADMHSVPRSWLIDIILFLKGKRIALLNKKRSERHSITSQKTKSCRPFTLRYFDVFQSLGLPSKTSFMSIFHSLPSLPKGMNKKITEKWIGIAPFSRYRNKTYPLDQMLQVSLHFASIPNTKVFLFGSKGHEATILKEWEAHSSQIASIAGLYTLQQELSIMAYLDIMYSMDSANMHMASLVGTRVVSIWGGTTTSCGFLGWRQNERDCICANLSCQPCTIAGSNDCKMGSFECMESITPKKICGEKEAPVLYVICPDFHFCTYLFHGIEETAIIKLITYKKRKTNFLEKILRVLRAGYINHRGLWNRHILDKTVLDKIYRIKSNDKVLFFGVENLKDLMVMEKEITALQKTVFLWNTISSRYGSWLEKKKFMSFLKKTNMTIGTFDSKEAVMYGLKYYTQMYKWPDAIQTNDEETDTNDVFFIGQDKGRSEVLSKTISLLKEAGAKLDIHILQDSTTSKFSTLREFHTKEIMPYEEVLHRIQNSKCILEIVQAGQSGLSIRAMEAMFLNKKLITNNTCIKDTDFYNQNNILVVDESTNQSIIRKFLNQKITPVPLEIINKYDINTWLQQFK